VRSICEGDLLGVGRVNKAGAGEGGGDGEEIKIADDMADVDSVNVVSSKF
jgi:hypothetical protein